MRLVLIMLLTAALSLVFIPAEAAQESYKGKAIGIVLSKSCLTLLKAHMPTTCPGYDSLISLDNSNQKWSGKFIEKDGLTQRGPAQYPKSDLRAYKYNSTYFIFVDPPKASRESLPLITIEVSLPEYHAQGYYTVQELKVSPDAKATKSVRTYFKDRWVDATCTNASISSKGGMALLVDTINYLKSNCDPKYTTVNTVFNDIRDLTKHDISTTAKWKLEKLYHTIKKDCLKEYGKCSTIQQATRAGIDDTPFIPVHHTVSLRG